MVFSLYKSKNRIHILIQTAYNSFLFGERREFNSANNKYRENLRTLFQFSGIDWARTRAYTINHRQRARTLTSRASKLAIERSRVYSRPPFGTSMRFRLYNMPEIQCKCASMPKTDRMCVCACVCVCVCMCTYVCIHLLHLLVNACFGARSRSFVPTCE